MPDQPSIKPSNLDNTPWDHRWGFADTEFVLHEDGSVELTGSRYNLSGYRMYDFAPYVEEVVGVKIGLEDQQPEVARKPVDPPILNAGFCEAAKARFRNDQLSFDDRQRLLHSHGQTTTDEVYRVLYDRLGRFADMVFFCESEQDAKDIVALAKRHDVCLVPYGGGTSVSCALKLPESEKRMIVSVDMRRMNRIEWIDRENLRVCAQAGIIGADLEAKLSAEGLTCGHEPDSIELSTLGGWIATNASGMKKNRYGNIEHVVENITMVTPEGVIEQVAPLCRASIGMQPQNLLFGNEGNLGLITRAVIKVHRLPEVTRYGSLVFPTIDHGVRFLYDLAHGGPLPASIRLVDNIQFRFGMALKARTDSAFQALVDKAKKYFVTRIKGFDPHKMVAATIVMEGSREEVRHQRSSLYRLAKKYQGMPGGAEAGQRGYMLTYAIAYIRDFVAKFHIIGETFETSVPWDKITRVCDAVYQKTAEKHKELNLPGRFYVSYRITQAYHSGVCIYFMMGLYMKGIEKPDRVYGQIEHALREVILENGGSISHHHGVGKLRKDFMKQTLSSGSIEFLKRAKRAVDPTNVFGVRNNIFSD